MKRAAGKQTQGWGGGSTYYGNRYSFAFPSPDCDAATKKSTSRERMCMQIKSQAPG